MGRSGRRRSGYPCPHEPRQLGPCGGGAVNPFAGMNLASLLEARASERGTHPLLVWAPLEGPPRTWSYAGFAAEVASVAGGLLRRGVRPGDRVLVQLENCPEALMVLFACARIGAVHVPVNAMAVGPELAWCASFTQAVGAVTQPRLAATLAAHCPTLGWLVVTDTDAGEAPAPGAAPGEPFATLAGPPAPLRAPDPWADALVMFTSGTTSRPKGVLWTQGNALWGARTGALQQALRADDVVQLFLPLFHVVALAWTFLPSLWAGATVVLQPRFSATRYWPVALAHGATTGSQVMFTLGILRRQPVPPGHRFRQWITAQCPPGLERHFGVPRILGAWSMTEVITQVIVGDPWQPQPAGSIGRPSNAYAVHVRDEDGRPLQGPGTGALLVGGIRGLSLFKEYFRDPQATAEAFDAQGLFRTGDRVTVDAAGFIHFADRARDVIKVGGESVSPAEIERVLQEVAFIREAAVVGRPDATYGEVPFAFVVLAPDHQGMPGADVAQQAIAHCAAALARFKVPRTVVVVADLPRVNFGKVAKTRLREMAHAQFSKGDTT